MYIDTTTLEFPLGIEDIKVREKIDTDGFEIPVKYQIVTPVIAQPAVEREIGKIHKGHPPELENGSWVQKYYFEDASESEFISTLEKITWIVKHESDTIFNEQKALNKTADEKALNDYINETKNWILSKLDQMKQTKDLGYDKLWDLIEDIPRFNPLGK